MKKTLALVAALFVAGGAFLAGRSSVRRPHIELRSPRVIGACGLINEAIASEAKKRQAFEDSFEWPDAPANPGFHWSVEEEAFLTKAVRQLGPPEKLSGNEVHAAYAINSAFQTLEGWTTGRAMEPPSKVEAEQAVEMLRVACD